MGPALKAATALDFDDLLLHPLTLFREHPDRLSAYRERFSFILVDEFQDTNRAQYELIRLLGAHGNVAAVRHRVTGVDDKVQDGVLHLIGVAQNRPMRSKLVIYFYIRTHRVI